jgi:hypothetical protein
MNTVIKHRLRMVNIAGAAGVVLLLAATAAFGVYPMWTRGQAYDHDVRDLQTKMDEFKGLTASFQDAERGLREAELRLAAREEELPSAEKEPNFYGNELTRIKKANGVNLASTDIAKEFKPWNGYKVGYIDLRGSADWNSCAKFLADIKAMKGLTRIDMAVLTVARDGTAESFMNPNCEFHISFSIFFKAR